MKTDSPDAAVKAGSVLILCIWVTAAFKKSFVQFTFLKKLTQKPKNTGGNINIQYILQTPTVVIIRLLACSSDVWLLLMC